MWIVGFIMVFINIWIVCCSNVFLDWVYGWWFCYSEIMSVGFMVLVLVVLVVGGGVGNVMFGLVSCYICLLLWGLVKCVVFKFGIGFSVVVCECGYYCIEIYIIIIIGVWYLVCMV